MKRRHAAAVTLLLSIATLGAQGPAPAPAGEWRAYHGDNRSLRYSPLDQITRANVATLQVAWERDLGPIGPEAGVQERGGAALRGRHALHDGRAQPRRGRARPGDRRREVAVDARRRRADRQGAAAQLWARRRLLARRPRRPHRRRHPRLPAGVARRAQRPAGPVVRHRRHGRSQAQPRPRRLRPAGADRQQLAGGDLQRRHRRRPGARARLPAEDDGQRARLRPRLRRQDRPGAVALQHHPAGRREVPRHLGERLLEVHRQRRRVGAVLGRRRAGLRLPAGRGADRRSLRRASPRRQRLLVEPRLPRRAHRPGRVALPADPPRHLGLRQHHRADAARRAPGRPHRARRWRW